MKFSILITCVILCFSTLQDVNCAKKGSESKGRHCGHRKCRVGQECTSLSGGEKMCICRKICPEREHIVCGSDGRTYHNKCELHRIACIEKRTLGVKHRGACPSNNDVLEINIEKKLIEGKSQKLPLVCFQVERDELRLLLVHWIRRRSVENDTPYLTTMRTLFRECDTDGNGLLDANNLLHCTEKGDLNVKDRESHILRGLCIDALIGIGSRKKDWMLTELDFKHIMEPNFVPPTKVCQLEDKRYADGAETKVDCNVCLCACGDWVCTGAPCGDPKKAPGAPGPVKQGSLPSQALREDFLGGFKAASVVNIPAVVNEMSRKRYSRDVEQQLDKLDIHR